MTSPFSPYQPPSADELPQSIGDRDPTASRRASLGQRFVAAMLDGLVSLVVLGPLEYKAGMFDGFPKVRPPTFAENALWAAVGFGVWFAIQGYFLSKSAQTIGKRVMGIRILNAANGEPAPLLKIVFVRYLPISMLVLIPKVGPLLSLVDVLFIFRRNRRCLHDQLADTVVMKVE